MMIPMEIFWALAGAGAAGGGINAILVDNVYGKEKRGGRWWAAAFALNMVIGAVAALFSWAAYGAMSSYPVFGLPPQGAPQPIETFTWSAWATAFIIGVGGPRWISNEVDKRILTIGASKAAARKPSLKVSQDMQWAGPARLRSLAESMEAE